MKVVPILCVLSGIPAVASGEESRTFDFGPHGHVSHDAAFDETRGYGFEPASGPVLGRRFSVRVPEGNFRVTVTLGSDRHESRTTVAAENRRLMLEDVAAARGKFIQRSFVVNVRTPALGNPPPNAPGGRSVRLKESEIGSLTWDDKLTLQFIGPRAAVRSISIAPVDVPVLYLVGDSTVTDQTRSPDATWGQVLPRFFDERIAVANHAESGESLKSSLTALRLDKVLTTLRRGDWLMIQFGHNDQKSQWPQTHVEAGTTYRAYLRAYIAEARRRGATPILVTSPERGNLDAEGRVVESHGEYPDAVRAVAREENVALIDLNSMSRTFYEELGPGRISLAFADQGRDRTHHSNFGGYELARRVVAGIREADPDLIGGLASHLDSLALGSATRADAKPFAADSL
jgi:lysophospholipase L1-like esterase